MCVYLYATIAVSTLVYLRDISHHKPWTPSLPTLRLHVSNRQDTDVEDVPYVLFTKVLGDGSGKAGAAQGHPHQACQQD